MQLLRAPVAVLVVGEVRGREARGVAVVVPVLLLLPMMLLRGRQHHPDVHAALRLLVSRVNRRLGGL